MSQHAANRHLSRPRSFPKRKSCSFFTKSLPLLRTTVLTRLNSEEAMATQSQTIPLQATSGVASESELIPAPALPPTPRKKQAAVLLSAFVALALTIGYNQCFGVFQEYYLSASQDVLNPAPASQVSPPTALLAFVGSLCYGLTWAGGILVNPVISRIEHGDWAPATPSRRLWHRRLMRLLTPRTVTILGVFMVSVGFTLASFCISIWQLILSQGLLVGLGMSLLYFPYLAPAPEYFTKHRATAMGFVSLPLATKIFPSFQVGIFKPYSLSVVVAASLLRKIEDFYQSFPEASISSNSVVHLDSSRWWHRGSYTFTSNPGASQLRRWSLDPQDLCRLKPHRRVTSRLGGASEPIRSGFDCRRTGKAKHPCLTRSGLETNVSLLCCGRFSSGEYSRDFYRRFVPESSLGGWRPITTCLHSLLHRSPRPQRV